MNTKAYIRAHLFTLLAMLFIAVTPSAAQFRIGPKIGFAANKLEFNEHLIDNDNRMGFSGGLQVEAGLPITGLSIVASAMYTHRNDELYNTTERFKRDFIEVPVHLKMGINLPIAGQILMPYAFTGPNFSFLFNESVGFKWENRDSNISWDVGAGVEILKHIQVQAAYGIGLTKALKQMGIEQECASIVGKDRSWTITAAYLF